MKAVRTSLIAAVMLMLMAGGMAAGAHDAPPAAPQAVVHRDAAPRPQVSMDQAVRMAQHRFRARVVRAETETRGGRTIYVLRMLDGYGRVFAVRVDAASGVIS